MNSSIGTIAKPTLSVARAPRSTLQDFVYRQLCVRFEEERRALGGEDTRLLTAIDEYERRPPTAAERTPTASMTRPAVCALRPLGSYAQLAVGEYEPEIRARELPRE